MGLSDLYEHLRKLQDGRLLSDTGDSAWEPPTRFTRDTTKFWLRPSDTMSFRVELIKHLPLLIFGKREKLAPGMPPLAILLVLPATLRCMDRKFQAVPLANCYRA